MRRKVASKDQNSTAVEKSVELTTKSDGEHDEDLKIASNNEGSAQNSVVTKLGRKKGVAENSKSKKIISVEEYSKKAFVPTTTSDGELGEGLENATSSKGVVQNSAVAIVSKRGRKKGVTENTKSYKLNDTDENSDKVVAVPITISHGELDKGPENATGSEGAMQNSAVSVVSKRGKKKGVTENAISSELNDAEENGNKAVGVPAFTSDGELEGLEHATDIKDAAQNSSVVVVSKRGRKKGTTENAKNNKLDEAEENSDKAVSVLTTISDDILDKGPENATGSKNAAQNLSVAVVLKRGRKKGMTGNAKNNILNDAVESSDKAVGVPISDGELEEGLENATGSKDAAQNSSVAVVLKRGRKKDMTEIAKSSKLNDAKENSDKIVGVPKRGRKPANKNLGDVKDSNDVKEETTDLKLEKSNDDEDLKVTDSNESQTFNEVPKTKIVPKARARNGRKNANNQVTTQKSVVDEGSENTVPEQEAVQTDNVAINFSSDENDCHVPSHSTPKNARKNTKKKQGPAKGKKNNDVIIEEKIESHETKNPLAVDDIYVDKNNAKSNPSSKRGQKRKNDIGDTETKQDENSPKSDALEDDSAAIMEEDDFEKPKKGRKAVKNIPTKALNKNAEDKAKTVPNPKGRSSKRKVEKSDKDDKETAEKVPKKDEFSKKSSKKEKIPDVTALDFSNKSTTSSGEPWNFKVSSWNINGIRAWLEKDGISYLHHEKPDLLCVQETKCSDEKLPEEVKKVDGYHAYWLAGDKDGYSGVGLLSKEKPLSVEYGIGVSEHDNEGRVITAEYEKFYLVAAYVPNSGRGLVRLDYRMQWDKDFCNYLKKLDEKKPIILCGDLNVAHEEIDLANPKTNKRNAGFTQEERDGFSTLLEQGFVDTFRHLYPDTKGAYTFWTYMMNARAKNVGWRLDYFVTSKRLNENVCDNVIRKDVYGSDHCPITLFLAV